MNGSVSIMVAKTARIFGTKTSDWSWIWVSACTSDTTTPTTRPTTISGPDTIVEVAESMMPREAAELYPYLIEFTTEHVLKPGYDFRAEFDFGLDAVLNALEAAVHEP